MSDSITAGKRISDTTILVPLGLSVTLFHVLTNGQYGFHRDELDIIMNARQVDWGYVSYRYGVKNEETTSHTGLYVCRQPRRPWPKMWAEMQWFQ